MSTIFDDQSTGQSCRVAIISSPRSGNTWLRRVLVSAYGLIEKAYHTPLEIPWAELPLNCALQIHWHHSSAFQEQLTQAGFRIVVLSRHPLDVLLSILQFAPHEPQTARWLDGFGGDEHSIIGKSPSDADFLTYALSPRAQGLLAVSQQWWSLPGVCPVRYETLVAEPHLTLRKIASFVGYEIPSSRLEIALQDNSFSALQAISVNNHFWKGQPGIWRKLIPAEYLPPLFSMYSTNLHLYGYDLTLESNLDRATSQANWAAMQMQK